MDPYFKVPVYIHDVDFTFWSSFPNFSLRLKGVLINDFNPETGRNSDTLLYAKTIDLKANTWNLLKAEMSIKSIEVQDARIGLRVDKNGKENFDIFVKDTAGKSEKSFEINLNRVLFKGVDLSFNHIPNEQEYRAFFELLKLSGTFNAETFDMALSSDFTINRFKDKSVTLLRKARVNLETDVLVDNSARRYEIPNTIAEVNGIPFNLNFFQDTATLNIELQAKKIPLEMIMESVHQADLNKLKNMSISGEAEMALQIYGTPKIYETPDITAQFSLKKGSLNDKESQLNIQKLDFEGKYKKMHGQAEILEFKQFNVTTMGQVLAGQISIVDFERPHIRANAYGEINLKALHHFFPLPQVETISGQLWLNGNLQALVRNPGQKNQEVQLTNSKSDLDCKKIQLKLKSDIPEFKDITGKISTRNDDFVFNQFKVKTSGSELEVSGKMDNLLSYLERDEALNFNAAIRAEKIDVNEFIKDDNSAQQKTSAQTLGVYVLPKNIFGKLEYDIKQILVGKHVFSKLLGITTLRNREMDFRQIQLEHIGSSIKGDFKIQEHSPGTLDLQGDVSSRNVDLKKLFVEWNNFEQKNILSENIMGNADAKLKFQLPYNMSKGPIKDLLNAEVSLNIVGGALIQLEALKEIAKSMKSNDFVRVFLGKNLRIIEQKLEKLSFEKLENTFYIVNSRFVIPKMTIRTNIMDLVVSGWQHFNETLEYHFEFDFKDLKQQNRDSQFGEVKQDGLSTRLFLKMFGSLSKLQFAWDSDARKAHKQEQRKQEKQEVKGMLKSEFGLFKKDSTVQNYQKVQAPKETITIDFGDEAPASPNVEKKKREINDKFNKVRKENQKKDEKVVIQFD